MDIRIKKFADLLVNYSVEVQPGEAVVIEIFDDVPDTVVRALVNSVYEVGGLPIVWLNKACLMRDILKKANKETLELYKELHLPTMQKAKAYIAVRGSKNVCEMSGITQEQMGLYLEHWSQHVQHERVNNTKWVIAKWPTPSMAQKAEMSTDDFEDAYFDACVEVDYKKMAHDLEPLVKLMEKTDKVHILGEGTDLSFSIKGIPVIPCAGKFNIPDGEVFAAPVRESVNGFVTYNVGTIHDGKMFNGVRLEFKDGKIIKAETKSGDSKALNDILDTDEGARYIGEFALGVNNKITRPMTDILFDEKINGSFHFTPGEAYEEAFNGNKSKIHWDMVCMQTLEYGGGEIWFDDVLIRKDGKFVLDNLEGLN